MHNFRRLKSSENLLLVESTFCKLNPIIYHENSQHITFLHEIFIFSISVQLISVFSTVDAFIKYLEVLPLPLVRLYQSKTIEML